MIRYAHDLCLSFTVISGDMDGCDISPEQVIAACRARLDEIERAGARCVLDSCLPAFDMKVLIGPAAARER